MEPLTAEYMFGGGLAGIPAVWQTDSLTAFILGAQQIAQVLRTG